MTRAWGIAVVFAAAFMGACSLFGMGETRTAMESLRVIAFPAANDRMATAIDVVFAYREAAAASLPRRAPEWFANKGELMAGAPGALEVVSCELPPGQVVESMTLPARHGRALRVVAYANYLESGGQHAVDLTPLRRAVLWLDAKTVGAMDEGQPMVPSGGE